MKSILFEKFEANFRLLKLFESIQEQQGAPVGRSKQSLKFTPGPGDQTHHDLVK